MRIDVIHDDRRIALDVPEGTSAGTISIDGIESEAGWSRIGDHDYTLVLDGRVFDLSVSFHGDVCTVTGRGGAVELRISDPRRLESAPEVETGAAGLAQVRAEMPGKVVRVLVRPGDSVAFGQGLVVLEAMKMQNEIAAPKTGVVREVAAVEGKAVAAGDLLVSLE